MNNPLNTNSMSKCVSLLLILTALWEDLLFGQQISTDTKRPDKHFEYKYSIKGPNLSQEDGSLKFWTLGGNCTSSKELILITPKKKSQRGSIWTKSKTSFDWWQIELVFRVSGDERLGGDGLAFWYTEEPLANGPVYGSADHWKGLALIFDSYDNDKQGNNPMIYAIVNDGALTYNSSSDGSEQLLANCIQDYRNMQFPTRVMIEYYNNSLTVNYHPGTTGNEDDYTKCFKLENLVLPKFGHFGVSAATGDLSDVHEVFTLLTHSVGVQSTEDKTTDTNDLNRDVSETSDKVVDAKEFSKIFGTNATEKDETHISASKVSLDSLVSSSISEDSYETTISSPTREILTIYDGTTLYDDEIAASPAIRPEPTTATKTATVSIRKDIDQMKKQKDPISVDSVANTEDPSNESNGRNTENSEPERNSENNAAITEASVEMIEDNPVKSTEVNASENNFSNGHNLNENPSKSSAINSENENTSAEENKSSEELPEQSSPLVPSDTSVEPKEEKTEAVANSSIVSKIIHEEINANKSEELNKTEANGSAELNEEKIGTDPTNDSSMDASEQSSKEVNVTKNDSNIRGSINEPSSDEVLGNVAAPESVSAASDASIIDKTVEEGLTKSDNNSAEESVTDTNSISNPSPAEGPPSDGSTENSSEIPLAEETNSSSESPEPTQSSLFQNDSTLNENNVNDIPSDPLPLEINGGQNPIINEVPVGFHSSSDSAFERKNQESYDIHNIEPKVEEPVVVTRNDETVIDDKIETNVDNSEQFIDPFVNMNIEKVEPRVDTKREPGWTDSMAVTNVISDVIPDEIEIILKEFHVSAQVVVISSIIGFIWCLMKILLSIFNSSRKECELRDICCKAERKIYYFEAEKEKMQKDIDRERDRAQIAEERMLLAERRVIPLEKEFAKIKAERDQLLQKVMSLESELETTSETAAEANRLLSDFLISQKENVNLSSSVEALQQQITKQAEIVTKYESTAKQKEKENRELKDKYAKLSAETERIKNLLNESEHNLKVIRNNNEELKASKNELNTNLTDLEEEYSRLQNKADEFSQKNEQLLADIRYLTEEVNLLKEQTNNKDLEIESLKNILLKVRKPIENYSEDDTIEANDQIDSENCDKSLNDIYDIVKMEIQVKNLTNDKKELVSKLEDVSQQVRHMNEKLASLEEDNKKLKSERETAVQERFKAQTELEVLTKYYKEKELEMGKEIGVQHIQRQRKEEDANSMASQLASFEEENVSLRSQLQSMKKEIEDTERKYKSQINQLEKQVHENWILARNAERKYDEAKTEASVLRQTLTMSVKSPVDGFGGDSSFMDDSASSISDHFVTGLPPPPPPPMPPPPMMPPFNPMMQPMHMPYGEESDWNPMMDPRFNPNVRSISEVPAIPQHFPPMSAFNSMPTDVNMNMNPNQMSHQNSQPVSYAQQMAHQWESGSQMSNRDTYSPAASHRSTSSPHPHYNMYSEHNNYYANPMTNQMSSPMVSNEMNNQYPNSVSSVTSPIVNSTPTAQSVSVFSEPIPSHWTPHQPNGSLTNLNYSQNSYNESDNSSRSESKNDRTDNSFHTSIV